MSAPNYRHTLIACYMGFITQAIAANFAPLLFITFMRSYSIPLEQLTLVPTLFFFTQLLTDLASAKFVDRIGYRTCVVASEVASVLGLTGLAVLPELLPDPFAGILISVIIYAIGSGLIEVLVSPIVEACPFENKAGVMSLLHSFYCWGSVMVILGSTLFFAVFGIAHWKLLCVIWAIVPAINIWNFCVCPIERTVAVEDSLSISQLLRMPVFWLLAMLMACSGASELSMSQWASAFAESALGVSKTVGDLAGPCLFAVLMGISRVFYGKFGEKVDLIRFMLGSGALCVACYLTATVTRAPMLGLIGCAVCGMSVGIMWPGTLSISSKTCPAGGTALFALLALAGDLGGSLGPSVVGVFSGMAGDNLRVGLLAAVVFPVLLIIGLVVLKRARHD